MSLVKKIGLGVGIGAVVVGLGYLGYKKLRGKKEESKENSKNICIPTDEPEDITESMKQNLENIDQNLKNINKKAATSATEYVEEVFDEKLKETKASVSKDITEKHEKLKEMLNEKDSEKLWDSKEEIQKTTKEIEEAIVVKTDDKEVKESSLSAEEQDKQKEREKTQDQINKDLDDLIEGLKD